MVALEIEKDGQKVENIKEIGTGKKSAMKLELGQEISNVTPTKVKLLFEKLLKLRERQDEQLHSLQLSSSGTEDCVGMSERDSAVTTMKSMQRFYNYSSETLADAVNYLDKFISKVKVKRRYLSCVAAAAFLLSTKMNEESEYHPTATDLANLHRQIWKPSDVKRMEKIILDKLDWNLYPCVTTLAYLQVIYSMLALISSEFDDGFLEILVERSELYINYTRCAQYCPCTLAVSIVYQCLKEADLSSTMAKYLLLNVQAVCRISDSELSACQCAISNQLQLHNSHPATHPRCLPLPKIVPRPNLIRRPSFYGNTDLPTIEEVSCVIESREESGLYTNPVLHYGDLVTYYPCPIISTQSCVQMCPVKPAQTYCQLLDQCCTQRQGSFFHHTKCNISVL